jgi:hypothetical protein
MEAVVDVAGWRGSNVFQHVYEVEVQDTIKQRYFSVRGYDASNISGDFIVWMESH